MKINKIFRRKKSIVTKGYKGSPDRPRLSVFRSHKYIYAQLIDDQNCVTLMSASEKEIEKKETGKISLQEKAKLVGELLAKKAIKKNIKKAIFDRRGYKYHGRVEKLAEGARTGGLSI